MFSTLVTGLPTSPSGLDRTMPLMPDCAVPSQNASTSSLPMPADANASPVASRSRSSMPLSQCSAKRVQPIPTIATRSRMPCDAMSALLPRPERPGLPEVVVDPFGGEQSPERHLDPVADAHAGGLDVRELDRQAPPPVEGHHGENDGRRRPGG